MIVFDLYCREGHRFEGWFGSTEDFGAQKVKGLLTCPNCGGRGIDRLPSATRFNTGAEAPKPAKFEKTADMEGKDPFAVAQMSYSRMLDELLTRSEDVGAEFPVEARRIHYSEAPKRAIRGQASQEEHDELLEEGIPVARLPIPSPSRWN